MSKAIYVVRGSEDGNIAAVTSSRRAARIAREYLEHLGELDTAEAELARAVRDDGYAWVRLVDGPGSAEIQRFWD